MIFPVRSDTDLISGLATTIATDGSPPFGEDSSFLLGIPQRHHVLGDDRRDPHLLSHLFGGGHGRRIDSFGSGLK